MKLYIVRHGWAYQHGDARWPDDSERPLEPEGAERFAAVVRSLGERGFAPTIIATSPYARCRQTADVIAAHAPAHPPVIELDALAPGSDIDAVIHWTRQLPDDQSPCWVGHAPDVSYLAAALVSRGSANIRFAKGAVAAIRLGRQIGYNCGELQWLATAKSLGL